MSIYNNISITNDHNNKVNSLIQKTITSIDASDFGDILSVGIYAFYHCTSLTNVEMSNTITAIEARAFEGCTALSNIKVSNKLRTIGGGAFSDCTSLTSLTIQEQVPPTILGNNILSNTPISSGTGYIYVPASAVDTYKAASG